MPTLEQLPHAIASSLLEIGAVSLRPNQPFTWTSGIKSPIYCDNRLTISYPAIRDQIADGFKTLIQSKFPQADMIAGIATAGIPHGAFASQKLDLPMIYVRDKAKGHGKENLIEGISPAGKKVVLVEDLISTGGSSLKAALAVKEAGGEVLGVVAIFTYQLDRGIQAFEEAGIPLYTLSNYTALIETALQQGKIAQEDVALLQSWRANPAEFGK
ncbi:orotate phosphoribosyltransferase [Paenibacillus sp. y28]|uniref:orotate phosphoribosyltransferase n=1 Tax=Paenibacillus sp. y28 TaxID=3129110 RepID=UPI003019F883